MRQLSTLLIGQSGRSELHAKVLTSLGAQTKIIGAREFLCASPDLSEYDIVVISARWNENDNVLQHMKISNGFEQYPLLRVFIEKPLLTNKSFRIISDLNGRVKVLFDRRYSSLVEKMLFSFKCGAKPDGIKVRFSDNVTEKRLRLGLKKLEWLNIFFVHILDCLDYQFGPLRYDGKRQDKLDEIHSTSIYFSSLNKPSPAIEVIFESFDQCKTIFDVEHNGQTTRYIGFESDGESKLLALQTLWEDNIYNYTNSRLSRRPTHSLMLLKEVIAAMEIDYVGD